MNKEGLTRRRKQRKASAQLASPPPSSPQTDESEQQSWRKLKHQLCGEQLPSCQVCPKCSLSSDLSASCCCKLQKGRSLVLFLVHSEWKNRSKFLTPLKWLFWHSLSLLDLRECILAIFGSPGPLGGVKGGMGGSGGVPGTKNCNFFGSHIWVTNWEILDCMNWKHFIFQVFGQKWPLRRPKMVVFGLKWVNTKVHFSQKHPL